MPCRSISHRYKSHRNISYRSISHRQRCRRSIRLSPYLLVSPNYTCSPLLYSVVFSSCALLCQILTSMCKELANFYLAFCSEHLLSFLWPHLKEQGLFFVLSAPILLFTKLDWKLDYQSFYFAYLNKSYDSVVGKVTVTQLLSYGTSYI